MYLGHGFDLSRSRDVIGHVIIFRGICFPTGVPLTPTCHLELFARY